MALNFEMLCAFEVQPYIINILIIRNNALHRKYSYLQKNESSIFKFNGKVFHNSPIRDGVFY